MSSLDNEYYQNTNFEVQSKTANFLAKYIFFNKTTCKLS